MGLSSSQARLLSLTGRMHDIEYKAQRLEAQKLQMANESAHVYQEYENALNATKIQMKQIGADGSIDYIDATYSNMLKNGYYVQFLNDNTLYGENGQIRDGLIGITSTDLNNYNSSNGNIDLFVALQKGIAGTTLSTDNNSKHYQEIYTAAQLAQITGTGNYILMADIDLSGATWNPKTFSGVLDGNGHTISGLKSSLFSNLTNAEISNLSLSNININNSANIEGGLADKASNCTISNISLSGTINSTCTNSVGGLIGEISNDTEISNISANMNITSNAYRVGGIIGGSTGGDANIHDCEFNGNVTGQNNNLKSNCGGIIGEIWGESEQNANISDCVVTGIIAANSSRTDMLTAGGILGIPTGNITCNIINPEFTGSTQENNIDTGSKICDSDAIIPENGIKSDSIGATLKTTDVADGGTNPTYREMFEMIRNSKYYLIDGSVNSVAGYENSSTWLTNMLNNAQIFLFKKDNTGNFYQVNVATDTNLQEVSSDIALKKAEAKYEADMRKINNKDKKFDTDLAALEQERNAIKTEMDTLKTVAKDNVDRTFKLFS